MGLFPSVSTRTMIRLIPKSQSPNRSGRIPIVGRETPMPVKKNRPRLPNGDKKNGRKESIFSKVEQQAFITELMKGKGKMTALTSLGLTRPILMNTIRDFPEFAEAIVRTEDARAEGALEKLYKLNDSKMEFAAIASINGCLNHDFRLREHKRKMREAKNRRVDSAAIGVVFSRIGEALYDLMPEDKRDEMIRVLESMKGEVDAIVAGRDREREGREAE